MFQESISIQLPTFHPLQKMCSNLQHWWWKTTISIYNFKEDKNIDDSDHLYLTTFMEIKICIYSVCGIPVKKNWKTAFCQNTYDVK